MVWLMYSHHPKFCHPCIVKSIKGPRQLFFCNLTVQKAYKSSLKNAHKSGYWMCEIGEKIKPQFKVDLIQFVNATTCCWNKKKLLLKVLLWWEVIQKTTYSRYHIQKLTKAWNILPNLSTCTKNPTIFNIIHWVDWLREQTTHQPSVWCSKYEVVRVMIY